MSVVEPHETLVHATSVVMDGSVVLIGGESGTGKTTFALEMCRQAQAKGISVSFLADDQTIVWPDAQGQLRARCPTPIRGKVEIRYHGVIEHGFPVEDAKPVALWVEFADQKLCDRIQIGDTQFLCGIELAHRTLPAHHTIIGVNAVFAAMGHPLSVLTQSET